MNRKAIRELAFKLIFSLEIQKNDKQIQLETFIENNEIIDKEAIKYITEAFNGILENTNNILNKISKNLKENWSLERLSKIDVAILKLAIFELEYTQLPYKVAINEAVELAKQYGDDNSPAFVNGILAGVVKERQEK